VYTEFTGAAYSYNKAVATLDTPVFFTVVYYTKDNTVREIFGKNNFKTVPYITASRVQTKRDTSG